MHERMNGRMNERAGMKKRVKREGEKGGRVEQWHL